MPHCTQYSAFLVEKQQPTVQIVIGVGIVLEKGG